MDVRRELTRRYMEIGGLLNTVADDDQRKELQAHGERVLNQELHAGSLNRAAVAPLNAALGRLDVSVDNVLALPGRHSMRVPDYSPGEPPDNYITGRGPHTLDGSL